MSIRTEHGYGPLTVTVGWLDNCPKCNNDKASVTGWSVSPDTLWAGDEAVCTKCGHKGEIDADGENAWVEWDEIKEASHD
ncbi:hypothetical protein [Klebsiella michiganensis]|uniref:hypothetical protein n=1 Tax=Klebsiella michiganensis TaxID=1134687 RepID=UPI00255AF0D9|nr:hypothetical protein [Klebsiella michiganensis]MDL4447726.1 hypothetical protein [Klebsiella michiganensis]MDL4489474.1 hypothetical protein [Klebsiella michiganensis]MDL4658218.1 hypothetical protein [Klebsiella michiganensis]